LVAVSEPAPVGAVALSKFSKSIWAIVMSLRQCRLIVKSALVGANQVLSLEKTQHLLLTMQESDQSYFDTMT